MRASQKAATLTHRLLAFARRQPLDPKPTDINHLVAMMSDTLHRTLGEAISIETVLSANLGTVSVDANQLESAILNLAVNARDAMVSHGKLTIETDTVDLDERYASENKGAQAGRYILLSLSDTGAGMTRDVADKAFEPFFTTKDTGAGTGLGLSQVYGFVKQSGGHVRIYSEPASGTTVKLYLPCVDGVEPIAPEPLGLVDPPRGSVTETILVIEDDDDVRANAVALLRELGYTVMEASDAASARPIVAGEQSISLIFTDVVLPGGVNGRQFADEARKSRPGIPVLFTTGYARNAIVHQGRLDPGINLLVKPFTLAALAAKVRQALKT
jgi:DNA-binding NtrC family response regulator